ncbi:hypothetical protein GNI_133270 [Gregarina niphandrodes]|uniref:Uncharacterized protein n=1 Tax=Gregarina niphandrodes TaxID=110365 RepID=A0A023B1E0_GRENI|nr:hypothetical protein GNI_133270 [Gregarina niphandrodes]EZG46759.1 hypothetical protein GNI_133270 [Gregarina niphandrodes]|eukprot:XP_011132268.1 hypothetical protein GNI_133270 [Gregarina niphandrodes]
MDEEVLITSGGPIRPEVESRRAMLSANRFVSLLVEYGLTSHFRKYHPTYTKLEESPVYRFCTVKPAGAGGPAAIVGRSLFIQVNVETATLKLYDMVKKVLINCVIDVSKAPISCLRNDPDFQHLFQDLVDLSPPSEVLVPSPTSECFLFWMTDKPAPMIMWAEDSESLKAAKIVFLFVFTYRKQLQAEIDVQDQYCNIIEDAHLAQLENTDTYNR